MPIFITEGAANKNSPSYTDEQSIGAVAKLFLLSWVYQVSNFNWYMWDERINTEPRIRLSETDFQTLTGAGSAFKEVARWMEDYAGNAGNGSVTVSVYVTYESLETITKR